MVRDMIDTGATHKFMANIEARQLSLTIEKDQGKFKAINSKALTINGTAKLLPCKVGLWNGNISFIVALLDDFNMVLGLEFLMEVRAMRMSTIGYLLIGKKLCVVLVTVNPIHEKKFFFLSCSLKKRVRWYEPIFIVVPITKRDGDI